MKRHPFFFLLGLVAGGGAFLAACVSLGYFIADLIIRAAEPARLAAVLDEAASWDPERTLA